MTQSIDQRYVDNLYAEIRKLTERAIVAETLLAHERESNVVTESQSEAFPEEEEAFEDTDLEED